MAAALEAAHRVGIVHRDLKPDNIFLVSDPAVRGGERIKVLDFGIAKLQRQASSGMATQSMMVFGTPRYMSPEQCKSAANVDHRSDIYTLGAILFELVTGQPPFAGEPGELIAQHLLVPPPIASSIAPGVPPELDKLISALLAKSPEARPQTMARVQLALEGDTSDISAGVAVTMAADAPSLPMIVPPTGRHVLGVRPKTNDPFRGNYDATALPSVRPVSNPTTLSHATGSSGPALPVVRKSRAALYAACGVLAIAAIAGGVMLRGGGNGAAAQVADTTKPAPAAAASPTAAAAPTAAAPVAAPAPAPAVAPAVAPVPSPVAPTPAPIAKTIPKAPAIAARAQAPAGVGSIAVSSRPACDIFVDGAPIGMHTPQRELKLAAGRHKITLVDTDAKIKDSFFVDIKPGSTQQIDKDYLPKPIAPPVEVPHEPVPPPPVDPATKKDGTINPFAHKTP